MKNTPYNEIIPENIQIEICYARIDPPSQAKILTDFANNHLESFEKMIKSTFLK